MLINELEYVYLEKLYKLKEIYIQDGSASKKPLNLLVDGEHLYSYNKNLYNQLINWPAEVIRLFDLAASSLFIEICKVNLEEK